MKIVPIRKRPLVGLTSRRALIKGMTDTSQIGMLQGDRTYAFDINMCLSDGAAALSASGFTQCAGSDGIVDLGGNQSATVTLPSIADNTTLTPQQPRIDAYLVMDVTAVDATTGDENYRLVLLGSNQAGFSNSGTVVCLGALEIGGATGLSFANGKAVATPAAIGGSRYEIGFTNEQNGVKYQYAKLYAVLAGTTPSITFKAFVAVTPEP